MKKWIAILAATACILAFGTWRISKARCFQLVGEMVCKVDTDRKVVALSFDDGPTPEGVDAVLPILAEFDVEATFFLIGSRMERYPDEARKILTAGHELGNHSFTHQRNIGYSQSFYAEEIAKTDALLRDAGSTTNLFRPPFGKRLIGLPLEVEKAGYITIMWDVEEQPEHYSDPEEFADDILARVEPGSIILMHPMYRHNQTARDALPFLLAGLQANGFEVVTVSELLQLQEGGSQE